VKDMSASQVADFERRRFQTAAAHYLSGRPPYPDQLIDRTVQLIGLGEGDRLLDLGCGPGQLALAFAPFLGEVVAMDPEPSMLAIAREAARDVSNMRVVEGRSDDLGEALGRFNAVVIGRAFHWMDREETLRRLDRLIEPGGAVVLFGEEHPRLPENTRIRDYQQLLNSYSADDKTHVILRAEGFTPHTSVLLGSAFNRLERIAVIHRTPVTLKTLTDRALSLSSTSRARLGPKADEMIAELGRRMMSWEAEGPMEEILSSSALIAWRG
jgi:SAM-dependent methyltransferase